MVQLGEKVSFVATYKSDLLEKNGWRLSTFLQSTTRHIFLASIRKLTSVRS